MLEQVSAPEGDWSSFAEAREAIETMPLRELEARLGPPAPPLLPWSGWSAAAGLLLFLVAANNLPLRVLGALVAGYGLLAIITNRSRAAVYREDLYRDWVRARAEQMADEREAERELE